jgi:hypothetical protein
LRKTIVCHAPRRGRRGGEGGGALGSLGYLTDRKLMSFRLVVLVVFLGGSWSGGEVVNWLFSKNVISISVFECFVFGITGLTASLPPTFRVSRLLLGHSPPR